MNRTNAISLVVAFLLLSGTGWLVYKRPPTDAEPTADASFHDATEPASPIVALSDAKAAVAGIQTEIVQRQTLVLSRTLPARFVYDDRLHVAVRAATDAVVKAIHVKPGDRVEKGTRIAELLSPAIGDARSVVLEREAEMKLAETQREWESQICDGVEDLVGQIRQNKPASEIQSQFAETTLGKYRGQLLSLYSKSKLADQLSTSAASYPDAISGRTVRERASQQQRYKAELDALIEQSIFETKQSCKTATANAEKSRRSLNIARQTLGSLLGLPADQVSVSPNETDLARLEVRSPLSGTIERRVFSATERVTEGVEMFIVANTSKLWVEADVRGRDWATMNAAQGDPVTITTPAEPGQRFPGKVHYIGREVDPSTGAVPLIVEVNNEANLFRPGMFARVDVPDGEMENVITVAESSVLDLDGQWSVFVSEPSGYRPVPVELGAKTPDKIEIRSGLTEGQLVVTKGAFLLKSELLLEGEE